MSTVVTLSAHRFEGAAARAWALWQMGEARLPLMRAPGLAFWKLCGSGSGAGFRPAPDPGVAVILAAWESPEAARRGLAAGPWRRWAARCGEVATLALRPVSSRGAWSGRAPFEPASGAAGPGGSPVAAITRASIRPRALAGFWRRVPRLDDLVGENREVMFRIGIGELPVLRQGTFSVWPSEAAMARYARTGAHAEAIAAVRRHDWFREALYARFEVLGADGSWGGRATLGGAVGGVEEALRAAAPTGPVPERMHGPARRAARGPDLAPRSIDAVPARRDGPGERPSAPRSATGVCRASALRPGPVEGRPSGGPAPAPASMQRADPPPPGHPRPPA